ncbi:MAG: hypothetical protein QXS24_03060 [Desulfurococcaceae archaeon]
MLDDKPFLSSRSIIEDYSLLLEYMKKCRNKGLDCSNLIPTSKLLDDLQSEIRKGSISFQQLFEYIKNRFEKEILCEVCIDAFKQVYDIIADCEEARKLLLIQLAGWYIEILETLGYIKLKSAWKP